MSLTASIIPWFLFAFFCGAIPFSVIVGRVALGKDIRQYGDGNPGAFNVMRAGGARVGALAAALDIFKAAIPVSLAYYDAQLRGLDLLLTSLAPVLGHAFSPFLRFRGGKAVAVTFGVWMALTLWEGPTILGIQLGLWYNIVAVSGWAMMIAMVFALVYFVAVHPGSFILAVILGNMAIVAWKHRTDLAKAPGWKRRR